MIDGVFPITDEALSGLNDEVVRFGKLLDNLNVLKKFEGEDIELKLEKLSLEKIISSVINDFYITIKDRGLKLYFNKGIEKDYYILGDENRLKQVFINLLSNAIKFNKEHGEIWINIIKTKEAIIVEIIDNGIGISKKDLPFIFERLYRSDKSRHEEKERV